MEISLKIEVPKWISRFARKDEKSSRPANPPKDGEGVSGVFDEMFSLSGERMTLPRIGQILQAAECGSPSEQAALFQLIIDRDPVIAAHLQTRMLAALACPWDVVDSEGRDNPKAAKTKKVLKKAKIKDLTRHLLNAIPNGYAGSTIDWAPGGADIFGFTHVHPTRWVFDMEGNPGLMTQNGEKSLADFHPNAFVFHKHILMPGIPCRGGLMRGLTWLWLYKHYGWRDRARFLEKFGIPFTVATISRADFDDPATKAAVMLSLRRLGADGSIVIPEGGKIDPVNAGTQGQNSAFSEFIADIDTVIAVVILGQTASSGDGGGLSKDQTQENVRRDIKEADCGMLAETISEQVVFPYEMFKYGTNELEFTLAAKPSQDVKDFYEALKMRFDSMGVAIRAGVLTATAEDEKIVRNLLELPNLPAAAITQWKKTDGVKLPITLQQQGSVPAQVAMSDTESTGKSSAARPSDPGVQRDGFLSELTENALHSLFDSTEAVAEYTGPVRAAVRKAFSDLDPNDPDLVEKFSSRASEFISRIPEIYSGTGTEKMEDVLRGSMLAAMVSGYADAKVKREN